MPNYNTDTKKKQREANYPFFLKYAIPAATSGIFLPKKDFFEIHDLQEYFPNCLEGYPSFYAAEKALDEYAGMKSLAPSNTSVLPRNTLLRALDYTKDIISYGHLDFCGLFDSDTTRTTKCIEKLCGTQSASKMCFAFTHTYTCRKPDVLRHKWRALHNMLPSKYKSMAIELYQCDDKFNQLYVDSHFHLDPTFIIGYYFAHATNFEAQVQIVDSEIYKSGKGRMVRSVVAVDKTREFNSDELFSTALAFTN